jgi:copper chaperone CopZ
MKTSVIEVDDMLSVLSVDELEKRMDEVPGVESTTVNFAARSATVRYDETRLEISDIKSAVRQRAYDSSAPSAASSGGHKDHTAPPKPPATTGSDVPKPTLNAPDIAGPASAPRDKADASTPKPAAPSKPPPSAVAPVASGGHEPPGKATPMKA